MLTVFIVDDEPTVVKGLLSVINWNAMGFEVCGTAYNGEEAIGQIRGLKPDLVITDVRMPKMDGIELSRLLREELPETEIVILSGYDEFDYVQSALRAGVCEYLLKPFKRSEFERTLVAVHTSITQKRMKKRSLEQMRVELEKYMPVMKNQLLASLSRGRGEADEEFLAQMVRYGTELAFTPFHLICIDLDKAGAPGAEQDKTGLLQLYLRDMMSIRLRILGRLESFEEGGRWFIILEGFKQENASDTFEATLEEICNTALEELVSSVGMTASIGISEPCSSYDELPKARRDCELALDYRMSRGGGCCVFASQTGALSTGVIGLEDGHLDQLFNHLRLLESEKSCQILSNEFERLRANKALAIQHFVLATRVLMELYSLLGSNYPESPLTEKLLDRLAFFRQIKTSGDFESECIKALNEVMDELRNKSGENSRGIVAEITSYINDNLAEDLSLQMVADHAHISRNYLCAVFKKELNETFLSYLTRLRMAKAKELLRTTTLKTYEIAFKVGYNDYVYFAQVFKKHVGITTTDYREAHYGNRYES